MNATQNKHHHRAEIWIDFGKRFLINITLKFICSKFCTLFSVPQKSVKDTFLKNVYRCIRCFHFLISVTAAPAESFGRAGRTAEPRN